MKKPKCFISYSHEDIHRDTLDYIRFLLKKYSNDAYDVLIDEDLPYGSDIQAFISLLDSETNAVLILLTPSYKKKVLEKRGLLYEEYSRILIRDQKNRQSKDSPSKKSSKYVEDYFQIIPILFGGEESNAIPDELKNIKYLNLIGLHVLTDPKDKKKTQRRFIISDDTKRKYVPKILNIISELQVIETLRSKHFEKLLDAYFKALFLELKEKPGDTTVACNNNLFVKTFTYDKIKRQEALFIIGRKGSGKTTITTAMAARDKDKYSHHISIIADDFNLETLYSLISHPQIRSDTKTIFSEHRFFAFAWEAFIYTCCMEVLLAAAQENRITNDQQKLLQPIQSYLSEIIPDGKWGNRNNQFSFFVHCLQSVTEFTQYCINEARPKEQHFISDLHLLFERSKFMDYIFGNTAIPSLYELFSKSRGNILVTLDGFDSIFDQFRRDHINKPDQLEARASFEISWLRALLHLILNSKHASNQLGILEERFDFCITIPEDRFLEVMQSERDSVLYIGKFRNLCWSGVELAMLLMKRLGELTQYSTDSTRLPEERLNQVLKHNFKHIPCDIIFYSNGKQYSLPLFLYILRHSMWRPREILIYFARIQVASELLKKSGYPITSDTICHIVHKTTREIVKAEFIGEFDTTIRNISSIIQAFTEKPQILKYNEVSDILGEVDFQFVYGIKGNIPVDDKIEFLYRIGFLGIQADDTMVKRYNMQTKDAFIFNEGDVPIDRSGKSDFKDYNFIIHPMFIQFLALDTSRNEPVLLLSWQYLHDNEAVRSA